MKQTDDQVRAAVRDHYASLVRTLKTHPVLPSENESGCCAPSCCGEVDETTVKAMEHPASLKSEEGGCCAPSCCGGSDQSNSLKVGYSPEDLSIAPEGADLGLGCGNPQVIASLKPGEIVLDLGAGAGFDAFLAARGVGPSGRVIGVDMTPAMLEKARHNAATAGFKNVEFRLGEIEHLPIADARVDVIISNCVINLSPDKPAVFAEAFRVLKSGGRLAISDVVAMKPLPDTLAKSVAAHACCISGATELATLKSLLAASGFLGIRIAINERSSEFIRDWLPGSGAERYVASATIQAVKASMTLCAEVSLRGELGRASLTERLSDRGEILRWPMKKSLPKS
jgi:arsenite methyltransferase